MLKSYLINGLVMYKHTYDTEELFFELDKLKTKLSDLYNETEYDGTLDGLELSELVTRYDYIKKRMGQLQDDVLIEICEENGVCTLGYELQVYDVNLDLTETKAEIEDRTRFLTSPII